MQVDLVCRKIVLWCDVFGIDRLRHATRTIYSKDQSSRVRFLSVGWVEHRWRSLSERNNRTIPVFDARSSSVPEVIVGVGEASALAEAYRR
jgi:hypothetical protein